MIDPQQSVLEWMREEFQDARRRHLLKTSETKGNGASPRAPTDAQPAAGVAAGDVIVTAGIDRSTPP